MATLIAVPEVASTVYSKSYRAVLEKIATMTRDAAIQKVIATALANGSGKRPAMEMRWQRKRFVGAAEGTRTPAYSLASSVYLLRQRHLASIFGPEMENMENENSSGDAQPTK